MIQLLIIRGALVGLLYDRDEYWEEILICFFFVGVKIKWRIY